MSVVYGRLVFRKKSESAKFAIHESETESHPNMGRLCVARAREKKSREKDDRKERNK